MRDPFDASTSGRTPFFRPRRHFAVAVAAAITGAAIAPGLGVLPASADPGSGACGTFRFSAAASSDLVRLKALDLSPLGVKLPPVVDARISTTRATSSGGPEGRSEAVAKYLSAKVADTGLPVGILDAEARQTSPPVSATGVTVSPTGINLPTLSLGRGTLTARTTWPAAPRCKPVEGDQAKAGATVLDATVLPANNGTLVRLADSTSSGSITSMVRNGGDLNPRGTATTGLAHLTVLAGTPGEIGVKVIHAPELRATAAGSTSESAVEYASPVLEVTLPGGGRKTLDNAHRSVDIPVPADGATHATRALKPVTDPLHQLVAGLPGTDVAKKTAGTVRAETVDPVEKAVPEAPAGGLVDKVLGTVAGGGAPEPAPAAKAATGTVAEPEHHDEPAPAVNRSTVRLSLGDLVRKITDEKAEGDVASLRVQVLTCTEGGDGYGGAEETVLDLGVGVLHAEASLPPGRGNGSGGEDTGGGDTGGVVTPPASGGTDGGDVVAVSNPTGTAGGSLPVTGPGAMLFAVGATVLVLVGRLLMVLAKRRAAG
jgi:hypothetical protein